MPSSGFDFSEYLENHSPVEGLGGELPLMSQLKIRRRELLRSDDDIEIYYFMKAKIKNAIYMIQSMIELPWLLVKGIYFR